MFVQLPTFLRSARGIVGDDELRAIEHELLVDPERGPVIPGAGGVRKLRVALQGRGKSSGARVIYYYRENKGRIYLILAYPKNRQANLTAAQKRIIRQLVKILETET